jgi:hypothetical protein
MVNMLQLSRLAEYFGVGQGDIFVLPDIGRLRIEVINQEIFKHEEAGHESKPASVSEKCCGTGGCPGCPYGGKL